MARLNSSHKFLLMAILGKSAHGEHLYGMLRLIQKIHVKDGTGLAS